MKFVEIEELYDLGLGAAILGSGGGGSPDYDILMAEKHLLDFGRTALVTVEELSDDAFVLPIAFAGAPLIATEMLPSGNECQTIFDAVEKACGRKPTHLMPAEIGGANALAPFLFAARLGIPVLDADTLGRAFPELQMSSCNLHGIACSPAFVADVLGNSVSIEATDPKSLENLARKVIVGMGSSALVGIYPMKGFEAKKAVIPGSISHAISLGRSLRTSKEQGKNPIQELASHYGAKFFGEGIIDDITQEVQEGFLNGTLSIIGQNGRLSVTYQNEYLKVDKDKETVCLTPEIIVVMDKESFCPIASEKLLWGMRVVVFSLPSPSIWQTEQGLQLVGPEYFGFSQNRHTRGSL
jgi:uncharacterized protein